MGIDARYSREQHQPLMRRHGGQYRRGSGFGWNFHWNISTNWQFDIVKGVLITDGYVRGNNLCIMMFVVKTSTYFVNKRFAEVWRNTFDTKWVRIEWHSFRYMTMYALNVLFIRLMNAKMKYLDKWSDKATYLNSIRFVLLYKSYFKL